MFSAPPLPTNFVARRPLADDILQAFERGAELGVPTALDGQPGFGKTTLAEWVCCQRTVQERFPDGIIWLTLGPRRSPGDVVGLVSEVCYHLAHERLAFRDLPEAGNHLGELLGNRRMLIVLDDLCEGGDAEPFLQGGPRCARLVTSLAGTVPAGAVRVGIDVMTEGESLSLLGFGLSPQDSQVGFDDLVARSGHWPLLLRLLNGAVKQRVDGGARLRESLDWVREGLGEVASPTLDITSSPAREAAVRAVVDVALSALERTYGAAALDRYADLAIFPEDADIPLRVLQRYWQVRAGWRASETQLFCRALLSASLIQRFNADRTAIRVHPLLRQELRSRFGGRTQAMNVDLLGGYRPMVGGDRWSHLPSEEQYLWSNLAYHLIGAGLGEELVATVTDPGFVVAKAFELGPAAVEGDMADALRVAPADSRLVALQGTVQRSAHLLTGFRRSSDLACTLRAQMVHVAVLGESLARLDETLVPPFIAIRWSRWHYADRDVVRVDSSHDGGPVGAVAYHPSGRRVFCGGGDGGVWVLDAASGSVLCSVGAHDGAVTALAVDASGGRVASCGADGVVRVWAAGSPGGLRSVCQVVCPAGSVSFGRGVDLVCGGADGVVRLWDAVRGALLAEMSGHEGAVDSVAFDRGGTRVVSGGRDGSVRIWDTTGLPVAVLWGHGGGVNSVCFDRSGEWVLSGGSDGTLRRWNVMGDQPPPEVIDHRSVSVGSVVVSGDGCRVLCGGDDGRVRIWDLGTNRLDGELQLDGSVAACCWGPGNQLLVGCGPGLYRGDLVEGPLG